MPEPLNILVVEDDPQLRDALCLTLECAGHRVLGAADGQAALRLLDREAFNLMALCAAHHRRIQRQLEARDADRRLAGALELEGRPLAAALRALALEAAVGPGRWSSELPAYARAWVR